MCSTPFGIQVSFRRVLVLLWQVQPTVLNAFRHPSQFPPVVLAALQSVSLCSTPFGIQVSFRYINKSHQPNQVMCSTPFGIQVSFRYSTNPLMPICEVLNAFRHPSQFPPSQHLFGSPKYQQVLNAFRHPSQFPPSKSIVASISSRPCSTPFGIQVSFRHLLPGVKRIRSLCAQRLSASKSVSVDGKESLIC